MSGVINFITNYILDWDTGLDYWTTKLVWVFIYHADLK